MVFRLRVLQRQRQSRRVPDRNAVCLHAARSSSAPEERTGESRLHQLLPLRNTLIWIALRGLCCVHGATVFAHTCCPAGFLYVPHLPEEVPVADGIVCRSCSIVLKAAEDSEWWMNCNQLVDSVHGKTNISAQPARHSISTRKISLSRRSEPDVESVQKHPGLFFFSLVLKGRGRGVGGWTGLCVFSLSGGIWNNHDKPEPCGLYGSGHIWTLEKHNTYNSSDEQY